MYPMIASEVVDRMKAARRARRSERMAMAMVKRVARA